MRPVPSQGCRIGSVVAATFLTTALLLAQSPQSSREAEIAGLLESARPVTERGKVLGGGKVEPVEAPRTGMTEDGYLRYLGAPPGHHFPITTTTRGSTVETARSFLEQRKALFGVSSAAVAFLSLKVKTSLNRSNVRFQQTYSGLPIFDGVIIVQVSAQNGIEAVHSSIARDLSVLDEGSLSLKPRVLQNDAVRRTRAALEREVGVVDLAITTPRLTLFVPAVMHEPGAIRLVWDMEVTNPSGLEGANVRVLLDAHSGEIAQRYPLVYHALNRVVSDANNTASTGVLVRSEGQGPCGIADADNAYQFLGDTYNFYLSHHGRDGIDGLGGALNSTVRYCSPNPPPAPPTCPMENSASYTGGRMYFGAGNVGDDVTGHELTHGVTGVESGLNYANASGAINESFSDVWGEFIDLTNGSANDTAANRWLIGEELPGGAIRSMKDPTIYGNPDRLTSPSYTPEVPNPTRDNDYGGVHNNSGVNNKLCYLLTDGTGTSTFNGQTIRGLGLNQVVALYYEVQVNLLTPPATWGDLFFALRQAAVNLGWNTSDRNNVYRACLAVEIGGPGGNIYVDKASTCPNPAGLPICSDSYGPYHTIAQGVAGTQTGQILQVRPGNYNEQMTIDKILTLEASGGTVVIGQ